MTACSARADRTRPGAATKGYFRAVAIMAARNVWDAGVGISDLAAQAGRSESTIRRWLKTSGLRTLKRTEIA
jgi:DNA-binding phage protein